MGGDQPVGDVRIPQHGQRVGTARMEAQEVLDVVLLPVVVHHERFRLGHCLGGVLYAGGTDG